MLKKSLTIYAVCIITFLWGLTFPGVSESAFPKRGVFYRINSSGKIVTETTTAEFGVGKFFAPVTTVEFSPLAQIREAGVLPVSKAQNDQGPPNIAYNFIAKEFLLVWWDERNEGATGRDIYGQLLSPIGDIKGNEFSITKASGDQEYPSLAYNSFENEYMVVWLDRSSGSIHGQRLSSTGELQGSRLVIDAQDSSTACIIYNNMDHLYLVVWSAGNVVQGKADIYGQILSSTGEPQGEKFSISAERSNQLNPAVAYNITDNEYMVVWQDYRGTTNDTVQIDIYGQILSSDGDPKGANFGISPTGTADWEQLPSIAYNDQGKTYIVVWQDDRDYPEMDIYGRLMTNTRRMIRGLTISAAEGEQQNPQIAYGYRDKNYLVVWDDGRGVDRDIYGQRLLADGNHQDDSFAISDAEYDQIQPAIAYNSTRNEYLVSWMDNRSLSATGNDIYARLIRRPGVNDPPVVSDIPDQAIAEGSAFTDISLDDYVSDPDNGDNEIAWTYSGNTELSVSISDARVATISIPDPEWSGSETIIFTATDPSGAKHSDTATFAVTPVNDPPVVSDIPDQTIAEGSAFTDISLDDYVSDPDNGDNEIAWTYSGNTELSVSISDARVATISIPDPEWSGSETIIFTATDPSGAKHSDTAAFVVTPMNDPPVVSDIPDQTIAEGSAFTDISLDDYVSDPDNRDNEIIWTYSGNTKLSVSISDARVATISVPDPEWSGSETITFTATDPSGAKDSDTATFRAFLLGDVNNDGQVNSGDAILVLRMVTGQVKPDDYQRQAADMNRDGNINVDDAILILRKSVGATAPYANLGTSISKPITVMLDEAHGVSGERSSLLLKLSEVRHPMGGFADIAYDNAVLRCIDVSYMPGVLLASNISEPGIVRIAFLSNSGLSNRSIAKIEFDILADDVSPLEFRNLGLYGSNALPIDSISLDGRFSSWAIAPEHSALFQNFPNPFNPDTWIPYQLRDASNVTVRIFSVSGELVRQLDIGHKPAGLYVSRDRAAHWDGRNRYGEEVPSGIYFYTIQAGDLVTTRKMAIE